MKLLRIVCGILFVCIITTNTFSETEDRILNVNECIQIALQFHPNVQVSIEERKRAMADYRVARAQRSLIVNGEIKTVEYLKATARSSESFFNVPGIDTSIGLFAGLGASYSLYNARKQKLIESAECSVRASKYSSKKTINEIIYNVKEAYYSYIIAKENLIVREKILKKNEERLKVAEILYRNGQRPIVDVSRAKVNISEAQLELEKASNNERLMRRNLLTSMGIGDSDIEPKLQEVETMPELKYTLNDLFKFVDTNEPDIQVMKAQKEISKLNIAVEKAQRYPDVNIQFSLGLENRGLNFDSLADNFKAGSWHPRLQGAILARFPIYTGGMITAKIDAAESDYRKMVYKERELRQAKYALVRNDFLTLSELNKQLEMAKIVVENAEKHFLLAQKTYQSGEGTQLELQDAQVSMLNAELSQISARYKYLITLAKISKSVGLSEDLLCKK